MKPDSETESLRGERVSVEHEGGLIERGQLFTMFATPILRLVPRQRLWHRFEVVI